MAEKGSTRIITVTSGKGGVGKTNISLNLALALTQAGFRTCIFDADLGLANIDILLGLQVEKNLQDLIFEHCALQDIIIRGVEGIDIVPGSSGVEKLADLGQDQLNRIVSSLSELDGYDFLLCDTSAGISHNVIAFCLSSAEILLVITPEPTSITDAYSLLKVLSLHRYQGCVRILVNQCKSVKSAQQVYKTFQATVRQFLSDIHLRLGGVIVHDAKFVEAVKRQQPLFLLYPESNAAKCIRYMAKVLLEHVFIEGEPIRMRQFWSDCLSIMKNPLDIRGHKERMDIDFSWPTPSNYKEGHAGESHTAIRPEQPENNGSKTHLRLRQEATIEILSGDYPSIRVIDNKTEIYNPSYEENIDSQAIDELAKSVRRISEELQETRRRLEEGLLPEAPPREIAFTRKKGGDKEAVRLDFDAFLKKHPSISE